MLIYYFPHLLSCFSTFIIWDYRVRKSGTFSIFFLFKHWFIYTVWVFGYLFHSWCSYSILLFFIFCSTRSCFGRWLLYFFKIPLPFFFFFKLLLSGPTKCLSLILCLPCLRSRISHFSKELDVLYWRMVFRNENLSTGFSYCYWDGTASRLPQRTELGNMCMNLCIHLYPYLVPTYVCILYSHGILYMYPSMYMYIYVSIYICKCLHIYWCIYVSMYLYVSICLLMYLLPWIHLPIYLSVYIYIDVSKYLCICL